MDGRCDGPEATNNNGFTPQRTISEGLSHDLLVHPMGRPRRQHRDQFRDDRPSSRRRRDAAGSPLLIQRTFQAEASRGMFAASVLDLKFARGRDQAPCELQSQKAH